MHQLELPLSAHNVPMVAILEPALPPVPLSARRRHVLALYLSGYQRAQIARRLGVSPNTVRNHIREIYDALGVSSKIEALRWALAQPALAEEILRISGEDNDRQTTGPRYASPPRPLSVEEAVSEAIAYFQRQVVESPMEAPRW
jgi:DNA-binding CsgD family transcriptional regulator